MAITGVLIDTRDAEISLDTLYRVLAFVLLFKMDQQRKQIQKHWRFWPCWRDVYAPVKWTIIGSDNGLPPPRRQAIIWTNTGSLWIWQRISVKFKSKWYFKINFSLKNGAVHKNTCRQVECIHDKYILIHDHARSNVKCTKRCFMNCVVTGSNTVLLSVGKIYFVSFLFIRLYIYTYIYIYIYIYTYIYIYIHLRCLGSTPMCLRHFVYFVCNQIIPYRC